MIHIVGKEEGGRPSTGVMQGLGMGRWDKGVSQAVDQEGRTLHVLNALLVLEPLFYQVRGQPAC